MNIKVTSNIFGKTDLTGEYELDSPTSITNFITSLNLTWDYDALVVVNDQIVNEDYIIQNGDHIYFLTPIVGG